jgi:uncharacterized protein DUF3455
MSSMNRANGIPKEIQVAEGEKLLLLVSAKGIQIYICQTDAGGKPAWVLKGPEAELYDPEGRPVGRHYAGPTWKLRDGSEVKGQVKAQVNAPVAGAIPWLLLGATSHDGIGLLSGVTAIQRINTTGGRPPAVAHPLDAEVKVEYSADYLFYGR